ncbi:MAG TPA: acyl carrier protein [Clostridium sp.]|jgi:acyl carrier protein|nr:acyl carrier protein [Clostridium sp.]
MEEKIKEILGTVLELTPEQIEAIGVEDDLIALGLDSLNSIEVIVNLECEFGIQVDDEDLLLDNIASVHLLMELIEKYSE